MSGKHARTIAGLTYYDRAAAPLWIYRKEPEGIVRWGWSTRALRREREGKPRPAHAGQKEQNKKNV